MFEKRLVAGWGDMDFNSHMRNTAFLDKSADVRMMFFAANGFSMDEFIQLKLGPVITKDELEYFFRHFAGEAVARGDEVPPRARPVDGHRVVEGLRGRSQAVAPARDLTST
ncbi:MAG: thioesterase family protein [Thermoanaerobaculia bacterium]